MFETLNCIVTEYVFMCLKGGLFLCDCIGVCNAVSGDVCVLLFACQCV